MKCPKCQSEIADTAKFCTSCGAKIEKQNLCPACSRPLKPGAKFCTHCGAKIVASPSLENESPNNAKKVNRPEDLTFVGDRIYWNIQKGQVARVIDEAEFATYTKIKGVIVPEGTTAFIRANGELIASISGGTYDFHQNPGPGVFRKAWQMIVRIFSFKKESEESLSEEEDLYQQQQRRLLDYAQKGAAFSIIVMLDKAFPLMIGAKQEHLDDYKVFKPMLIQTSKIQMNVGVNAYFKIFDKKKFIIHYLTDTKNLNSASIADDLADLMRVTIQDALYNVELTSSRIPHELHAMLKDRLNAVMAESFFGLSIVRVVEISAQSDDLDRFAQLSSELYLSEQELDYLRRTNDFKNRLADATNQQLIHEATNEVELLEKLNEINRNKEKEELLHADELLKFKSLLENERILREARSNEERDAALAEIRKTELIREEDLDVLQHQQAMNSEERNMALAMMRLKDGVEFERTRTEGQLEQALLVAKKELERAAMVDDYADERFYKELQKQKSVAEAELDVEQRTRDMDYNDAKRAVELEELQKQKEHERSMQEDDEQFKQFMAMQQQAEQSRQNARQHEANMQQARLDNEAERERMRYEQAHDLSEDQLWALNGDAAAAAEFVKSKYNAEAERKMHEKLEEQRRLDEARLDKERAENRQDMRNNQDRMYDMMKEVMHTMSGMQNREMMAREQQAQERERNLQKQMNEKDERILRQEGRMDTAYDRALDYSTRDKMATQYVATPTPAQPQQQVQPQQQAQSQQQQQAQLQQKTQPDAKVMPSTVASKRTCPECGADLEEGAGFCADCGCKIN